MANFIRPTKSGSDWTLNDLDSYHISLDQVDTLLFFGLQELPQLAVDPELPANADADAMQQDSHAELITYLDFAMITEKGETAVGDFVVELFKTWGYVHRERVARTRVDLSLLICGENRYAKADVCIVDRSQNDILLLVQVDKRLEHGEPVNARAQLVAAAAAAFNEKNAQREVVGLPPVEETVIPGIVMVGTSPVFFKISVTRTLSAHICHGTYPPEETRVTYGYPPVPRPARRRSEGMKPLDNRREILKCYEAFRVIAGI
ncbi:hypothetical protein F5J12DRAFT_727114 [Pisolithus orientalis]|uniref:uncharacterized protein n=1 Tax=Pisolithus orientalis TaxID=936130 RepID=UPI002224D396|nr:uncharacterized protein F5J12DRAFT_727114 [Pisolithus orientalis]KAI5992036.1 hypothetical protein F5J12DRAFT_727114 [Pisolithus orientalis]